MILSDRPTSVRWWVLGVTTLASVLLYLDRFCVSIAAESMRVEFHATKQQDAWFQGVFFLSYALFQVPAGMLSQRFGIRSMLVVYILAWSAFTGVMGLANSFWLLIVFRLGCGLAQAGAYPSAARAVRDWMQFSKRGVASSIVALGGRVGGAIAPLLTGWLMIQFALQAQGPEFRPDELIDYEVLQKELYPTSEEGTWRTRVVVALVQPMMEDALRRAGQGPNRDELVKYINAVDLLKELSQAADREQLPLEIRRLIHKAETSSPGSSQERARVNRQLWEQLAPRAFKKLESRGWRLVMFVYGAAGIFVAAGFWFLFRETPMQHPWCNAAEQALIAPAATSTASPAREPFPWRAILTDISLWGNCLAQVGTNIGWVFLVTWLPRYLDEVHHVPVVQRGFLASLPLWTGMAGMLLGGPWTDIFTERFGLRWGRRLPVVLTRITAALGCGLSVLVSTGIFGEFGSTAAVAMAVAGSCLVAISTDLAVPATWAFAQDVGGRHTAAILGWGNMWGNLGAFVAPPLIYNPLLGESPGIAEWNTLFAVCGSAFIVSGIGGLLMDASRPIGAEKA